MPNIINIIISSVAIIISLLSLYFSYRNSKINIVNGVQELMLRKASNCNELWKEAVHNHLHPQATNIVYQKTILEVITTMKLLDNCLKTYSIKDKGDFLIMQFWLQLDVTLRDLLKDEKLQDKLSGIRTEVANLQEITLNGLYSRMEI